MNDAEIAKALLVHGGLNPITMIPGPPEVIDRYIQLDHTSFDEKALYKIKLDFKINGNVQSNLLDGGGHFITNWHIENSDKPRGDEEFVMFDDHKIYVNEVIGCNLRDIRTIVEPDIQFNNPFSKEVSMVKQKITGWSGTLYTSIGEDIAKAIFSHLNSIYFIPEGRI